MPPKNKIAILAGKLRSVFMETTRGYLYRKERLGLTSVHHFANPEHVRAILKNTQSFPKPPAVTKGLSRIIGNSIFTDDGEDWQKMHNLLSGVFTPQMVSRNFAPLVAQEGEEMIGRWLSGHDKTVDVEAEMRDVGARIIARSIFGAAFSAAQSREIVGAANTLMAFEQSPVRAKIETALFFLNLPAHRLLPVPRHMKEAASTINAVVEPLIRARRKSAPADDILGRLLAAKDPDTGRMLSDREIRDQVVMFMIAGHETTAVGLTFAFTEILKQPDVLAALRREIDGVTGGKAVTAEDFGNLPSVRNAFKEALRLHPPAFSIVRKAAADASFDDGRIKIKKGDFVSLIIRAMQRRPELWGADGETFRPERFINDPRPAAFMPFGYGPRVCLGQRMAVMEGTLLLAAAFNKVSATVRQEPQGEKYGFTMRPQGKLLLNIAPR